MSADVTYERDWHEFVPGYAVSRFGDVYSLHNNRRMTVRLNAGNRRVVHVMRRYYVVARLVARAFVPGETPERWTVNHVDGDRINDRWDNLDWASISDQIAHARENALHRHGERHPRAKIRDDVAKSICALCDAGMTYADVARTTGVQVQTVIDIATGRTWKSVTGRRHRRRQRRLTPRQINDIRNSKLSARDCAATFGVGMTTVYRLRCRTRESNTEPPTVPGELWRSVPEFDSYAVSSHGRVFSHLTGKLLQTSRSTRGNYVHVALRDASGKPHWLYVHRLVALAFLSGQQSEIKDVVDHVDGNKVNNRVENLRFACQMDNLKRSSRGRRRG